jgi:hypothetical protein
MTSPAGVDQADARAPTPWKTVALTLAMAAHPRLGSQAPRSLQLVCSSRDLLMAVLRHVWIVIPDDVPTLAAALAFAAPWQKVLMRSGEHIVNARSASDPGSSILCVRAPVELFGEPGTVIRGTVTLDASSVGGRISNLRIDDGGDCCVRCEGGSWQLSGVRLRCSHGSALLACNAANLELSECVLGGEGADEVGKHVMLSAYGSVQDHGLAKRSCYAVVARNQATVHLTSCTLRQCSEAAVLVAHEARVSLDGCAVSDCTAAFVAGTGYGRSLELRACTIAGSMRRLWADSDRPKALVCGPDTVVGLSLLAVDSCADLDGEGSPRNADIVPLMYDQQPRGAEDDSEGSLSDPAEFAGMEALMEELDLAAMSAA